MAREYKYKVGDVLRDTGEITWRDVDAVRVLGVDPYERENVYKVFVISVKLKKGNSRKSGDTMSIVEDGWKCVNNIIPKRIKWQ